MKLFKKISLVAVLMATVFTSCEKIKDFGDTNVDPNRTTTPNTAALLTNVLANISNRATQQNPGYFCQYFGETQLVNKCTDGSNCTEQEYQLNRRAEFKQIPLLENNKLINSIPE